MHAMKIYGWAFLVSSLCWTSQVLAQGKVEAVILTPETWDEYCPQGKEVDAIYGDLVLRNDYITAVIAQPVATRNANMTVRNVGGCLIDLTENEYQSDQLSCFYPGGSWRSYKEWHISKHETFGNGRNITEELNQSENRSGDTLSIIVCSSQLPQESELLTAYTLGRNDRALRISTGFRNVGDKPLSIAVRDEFRLDFGKEDAFKSPNGDASLFAAQDKFWRQAYLLDATDTFRNVSDSRRTRLSYQLGGDEPEVAIPVGELKSIERHLHVARFLPTLYGQQASQGPETETKVELHVHHDEQPIADAVLEIKDSKQSFGWLRTDEEGRATTLLPRGGEFALTISIDGVPVTQQETFKTFGTQELKNIAIDPFEFGHASIKITDSNSDPIPCKIEFQGKDDTPTPDWGPETADAQVKNLVYAHTGEFTCRLPAGKFDVIISRGPEYDALFQEIEIKSADTAKVTGQLERVLDTTGWVSADFHSHSSPSGDNTGSQFGRVLNLVCEHVEFGPCTEHNRISTYVPHIEKLGMQYELATVSGIELTGSPLPINHQNAFPMKLKPRMQDGGGPITDVSPEKQIERIMLWDDRSEKLIQQNHPDIGWLFFDKNGDGQADEGFSRSFMHIDAMEIHPLDSVTNLGPVDQNWGRETNHRIFNWLQLLNRGFRITGVVNTDAHYNFHGSGGLRNWIKSSTDEPNEIDPMEMVRASEAGNLIMSNGPFLEVEVTEGGKDKTAIPGDEFEAKSAAINISMKVQCPNWCDINRVFVLVNGRAPNELTFTRKSHPDLFGDGVVKFSHTAPYPLPEDAHIVVAAVGDDLTLGKVQGPGWGNQAPAALTNPIYIDIDGNGFAANGDLLDAEVPVKFGARK